jgi:hypothetical protein
MDTYTEKFYTWLIDNRADHAALNNTFLATAAADASYEEQEAVLRERVETANALFIERVRE